MHKNATKCNETIGKWCKNKHGASKIIDTFETYQHPMESVSHGLRKEKWGGVPSYKRAQLCQLINISEPLSLV
jgi:hypothetical protein